MNITINEQEKDLCRSLVSIVSSHPSCKKLIDNDYDEEIHLSPFFQLLAVLESLKRNGVECEIDHKVIIVPNTSGVIVPALSLKGWILGVDMDENWEGIALRTLNDHYPDVSVKNGIWTIGHNLPQEEIIQGWQENEGRLWIMPCESGVDTERPKQYKKVSAALASFANSFFHSKKLDDSTPHVQHNSTRRRTL